MKSIVIPIATLALLYGPFSIKALAAEAEMAAEVDKDSPTAEAAKPADDADEDWKEEQENLNRVEQKLRHASTGA
jgi:hypothetical protein